MGPVGRYEVRVLKEAEDDPAWKSFFQVPGDAREMRFKLALLEGCAAMPPHTERESNVARCLDIECVHIEGQWIYALEYTGQRGEREPWLMALFYVNGKERAAYVVHVVTAKEYRARRHAVMLRAADRALRHQIAKASSRKYGGTQ